MYTFQTPWEKKFRRTAKQKKWSLVFALITSIIVSSVMYVNKSADVSTGAVALFFVFQFVVFYVLSIGYFVVRWALGEMGRQVGSLIPQTPYVKKAKEMPEPPKTLWRFVSTFLGVVAFILVFNFFILLGIVIGYLQLTAASEWWLLEGMRQELAFLFTFSETSLAYWCVFFILFVLFPVWYSIKAIHYDPALKVSAISPKKVFDQIMIMWLTFARGDEVRLKERSQGEYGMYLGKKLLMAVMIGLVIDVVRQDILAIPVVLIMTSAYVLFMYIYKVDPEREGKDM